MPEAPAGVRRPPLALALVLDRSGSMAGRKLETTKACVAWLTRRLAGDDHVAVVAYDDAVELRHPLTPVDAKTVAPVLAAIVPRGTTNLSGGWLKGLEVLRGASADATRRVLLLTDGLANVGITDPATLAHLAAGARDDGVSTTTIGFGADFDEALLTAMADAGGGSAHFAETPDAAPGIFAAEFEGLVAVVAQNVSVEIRPRPQVRAVAVLNDYPVTPVPGGLQLALGDAYGGERRSVVFELHLQAPVSPGPAPVAEVVLRYVSVGQRIAAHELTLPVAVRAVRPEEAEGQGSDAEVTEEVVVLKAARAADEARRLADAGDLDGARASLAASAEELRRLAPGSARAAELEEQAEALDAAFHAATAATWGPTESKRLHYEAHRRRRRRDR